MKHINLFFFHKGVGEVGEANYYFFFFLQKDASFAFIQDLNIYHVTPISKIADSKNKGEG